VNKQVENWYCSKIPIFPFSRLLLWKVLEILNFYLSEVLTHSAQSLKWYYLLCSDVKHNCDKLINNYKSDNISKRIIIFSWFCINNNSRGVNIHSGGGQVLPKYAYVLLFTTYLYQIVGQSDK